jgi:hypothetical protein
MSNPIILPPCLQCRKDSAYRDKLGKVYCYDCYWNLEENASHKPKGELFSEGYFYRSCPYCNSGDICSIKWCIARCGRCGIVDKLSQGSCCLECSDIVDEELAEKREKRADEIGKRIERLKEIEIKDLSVKNYLEVGVLQKQTEILIKEYNEATDFNPKIIGKKSVLEELEKHFPERIRIRARKKECSTHKNIIWKKQNKAYCLDCGESESDNFLRELRAKLRKDIFDICKEYGVSAQDLRSSCPDWEMLRKTDKPSNQEWLLKTYQNVRGKVAEVILKEKGIDVNQQRERESQLTPILSQKQY